MSMNVNVSEKNIASEIALVIEKGLSSYQSLPELRKEAFQTFQQLGLPGPKAEEYKDTPIARVLQKNFTFQPSRTPGKINPQEFLISGLDANIIVFVNGFFSKEHSRIVSPDAEISISPLKDALADKNPEVLKHLGKYADFKTDALVAWNTAAWSEGIFIQIKNNKVVDKPVVLHYIHDSSTEEVSTINRNLIVAGTNSKFTVIEKYDSVGKTNHFSNTVTEAVVSENAEVNFYSLQNDLGNGYQYSLTQFYQANHSRVNTFTFTLNGKLVRNNLQLALDGEGIESHMFGLYLLDNDTLADNHTVVDHKKANSFSNELYKGIMDGSSKGVFNGKIYVRPNAQKTNAFQANRNILLTDKATINTKPQLEIWADDVKCSHGCTTGQLDEEAMFYLQTRGISKESARAMMLYAFAGEILDHVNHAELKEYIDQLISERLHKNFWL
jgi:Fe-S cluster assembly protein SufD